MVYETLGKLYYKNPQQYERVYQERLQSEAAVRLDFFIGKNQTFFLKTPELLEMVIRLLQVDKEIQRLQGQLPGAAVAQFQERCLIDEIVLTNQIEGVHSTRREIGALLADLAGQDRRRRFYGLVKKYLLLAQAEPLPLSTCRDVRAIYDELVLAEVAAEDERNIPDGAIFRQGAVSVLNAVQKEIHRGLYPESAIIEGMSQALAILRQTELLPLFRIGIFHYLWGYIHPFYEGNGRTSRFISSYLLAREFEPLLGYRLSYTIRENINEYYAAFKTCNEDKNKGDLTPFLLMFCGVVERSLRQLEEALRQRRDKLDHYTQILETQLRWEWKPGEALCQLLLQATLFAESGVSTQELLSQFQTSRASLSRWLQRIRQAGLLVSHKQGRENYYQLELTALDALGQPEI